jgi:geranylgeranyl diphosphate synthase type II
MNPELRYAAFKRRFERYLKEVAPETKPASLFSPTKYVLSGGGKRIRPLLVVLSCEAVGGKSADALSAAAAVEILHNFTLVHDDIMDNADTRRGRSTVHKKWNTNVAILAGDAMLGLSYRALLRSPNGTASLAATILTKAYLDVCKGQALDKEFESRHRVTVAEYLSMISLKTGRLIAAATEIGAAIGGATPKALRALRTFGERIGRAFQIQDDLLDVVADEEVFGKAVGGDIVEGKKTFLLLHALEHARQEDRAILARVVRRENLGRSIIPKVRAVYERTGAIRSAQVFVARDTQAARHQLQKLLPSDSQLMLLWLTNMLEKRLF